MSTTPRDRLAALSGLSHLDDPLRRRLYEYVASHDAPVSREAAAAAADIGRTLAAYHLDKLTEAGLLAAHYRRPEGRGGPGAGRPAKLYTPAMQEMTVSVPPREYELLASLLVTSVEQDTVGAVRKAVNEAARDAGTRAGNDAGGNVLEALRHCGYLPQVEDEDRISLRNCPFHIVAQDHKEVVCGLNLHLVEGIVAACGDSGAHAELEPRAGRCCVVVNGTSASKPSASSDVPTPHGRTADGGTGRQRRE